MKHHIDPDMFHDMLVYWSGLGRVQGTTTVTQSTIKKTVDFSSSAAPPLPVVKASSDPNNQRRNNDPIFHSGKQPRFLAQ